METTTYVLPAYLAGYLINGDSQGLTDTEENEIKDWLTEVKPGYCVECSDESFFKHSNDLNNKGADCLEYTFLSY